MAKFKFEALDGARGTDLWATKDNGTLSTDELLEVLRPAAMRLKEIYQQAIRRTFRQRTGSLANSIDFEDNYGPGFVSFIVKPFGSHKGGTFQRKSRAGDPSGRYAKHNRKTTKKAIKNEELAYLLEYGTPRIAATHWMEIANDESAEEIQNIIEKGFNDLLSKKGL